MKFRIPSYSLFRIPPPAGSREGTTSLEACISGTSALKLGLVSVAFQDCQPKIHFYFLPLPTSSLQIFEQPVWVSVLRRVDFANHGQYDR